ncbi:MAG: hypothetical protein EBR82_14265 [Caulobacteraceae bacterium]|nr:hypothetical protein [Caulobacteraceae bacterium]
MEVLFHTMPNDCWNHLTITANVNELTDIMSGFKFAPEWANKIFEQGVEGVYMKLWSRSMPDFEMLEHLITKYPSCWIKNEWSEEGGKAGVWVGTMRSGEKKVSKLEWDDMCLEERMHRFRKD